MSSYEGTSDLASNAMRSTIARLRGGRATPSVLRSYTPPSLHKTWQPLHGIVFGSSPASNSQRPFTTNQGGSADRDLLQHSTAEDNYVLAPNVCSEGTPSSNVPSEVEKPEMQEGPVRVDEPEVDVEVEVDSARQQPPVTSFEYKMAEDLFQKSRDAEANTPESFWSHTIYRGPASVVSPNIEPPRVKVHYCQSLHTTERVLSKYFLSRPVVGFDIEWMYDAKRNSGPKQNVSLIQIAIEERIALIHIALYPKDDTAGLVAPSLKYLMENPTISKVGVNIKGDCTRLKNNLGIYSQGVFELSHLYRLVKYSESKDFKMINKKLVALGTQVLDHLHLPMFKGQDVRSSDWSKKLNMEQITYAAGDSYAGLQLYNVMDLKRKALDPCPPLPFHAELDKPIRLAEGVLLAANTVNEEEEILEEPEFFTAPPKRSTASKKPRLPQSEVTEEPELDSDDTDAVSTVRFPKGYPISKKPTSRVSSSSKEESKSPLIVAAEEALAQYRASTAHLPGSKPRATTANLRAFFIWQANPDLSIADIAACLRDPPLLTSTVAGYILETVRLEDDNGIVIEERERLKPVIQIWKAYSRGKNVYRGRYARLEKELLIG